jgi:hypothetical protein
MGRGIGNRQKKIVAPKKVWIKPRPAPKVFLLSPRGGARGVSPRFTSAPAVAAGHVSRSERPAGRGEGKTTVQAKKLKDRRGLPLTPLPEGEGI